MGTTGVSEGSLDPFSDPEHHHLPGEDGSIVTISCLLPCRSLTTTIALGAGLPTQSPHHHLGLVESAGGPTENQDRGSHEQ